MSRGEGEVDIEDCLRGFPISKADIDETEQDAIECGGSIEVFPDAELAKGRAEYIQGVLRNGGWCQAGRTGIPATQFNLSVAGLPTIPDQSVRDEIVLDGGGHRLFD